jgi:hypothetical protein
LREEGGGWPESEAKQTPILLILNVGSRIIMKLRKECLIKQVIVLFQNGIYIYVV